MGHVVHLPRGLEDKEAQHFRLRCQLHQRELDRLIARQLLAEGLAFPRIFYAFVDAIERRAAATRRLPDAVLVDEALRQREAAPFDAEDRAVRHPDIGDAEARVIGGHVEGPHPLLDLQPLGRVGDEEAGDPARVARLARRAREHRAVGGDVHPGDPHLLAIDPPAVDAVAGLAHRDRLHVGGVGAVVRFGEAEGDAPGALEPAEDEFGFLFLGPPLVEHGDEGEVADDGVLVLQIIVQAEALPRKMLADHRHPEVRAVLAAIALGGGEAPMARLVGAAGGFLQKLLPLVPGQPAALEVRARIFAAVIEEADVVVLRFERLDLGGDEGVEFIQVGLKVGGDGEVH